MVLANNVPLLVAPNVDSRTEPFSLGDVADALTRSAGTGIYVVQDGVFLYTNHLFQELTGFTESELLGVHSLDLVHPDDRELVRTKAIENLRSKSDPRPYEYRFIKKNGATIWVLEKVTSTYYNGRRATVGSFMDVTEHKQAMEELKQSLEKIETTLDTTINAMASVVELRDPYTAGHQRRVADLASALSREMGLMRDDGIIEFEGSHITLNDVLKLEKSIS